MSKRKINVLRVSKTKQIAHLPTRLRGMIAYLLVIRAWFHITHEGQLYLPVRKRGA